LFVSLHLEFDGDVQQQGIKRKHNNEDDDAASVDALEETLLRTCISKLSVAATAAKGSRRRRTLRHVVLINNMLRSLEHDKTQNVEPQSQQRLRITARRSSSDTRLTASSSRIPDPMRSTSVTSVELSTSFEHDFVTNQDPQLQQKPQVHAALLSREQDQQLGQLLLSWQPQHLEQLLSFSSDTDNVTDVMSSPTATFCPLLAVDLTVGMDSPMFDDVDSSRPDPETPTQGVAPTISLSDLDCLRPDPETLDISCDYSLHNTAVNFYETVPLCKPATLPGVAMTLNRSGSVST